MPDAEGHVWFTSKFGVVGMVLADEAKGVCPPVYTTSIAPFALGDKLHHYSPDGLPEGGEEFIERVKQSQKDGTIVDNKGKPLVPGTYRLVVEVGRCLSDQRLVAQHSAV